MNHDFTVSELDAMHLAVITRCRVLREQWIPIEIDTTKKEVMIAELHSLDKLSMKVCAAKLSKELGFYIEPVSVPA